MITDPRPRGIPERFEYDRSDKMIGLSIPADQRLREFALEIERAMASGLKARVGSACGDFLCEASLFYGVVSPGIQVLDARPLRVYETVSSELFGDYHMRTCLIRVWMRTAVQKRVTSFGTFLSTLCHEFCHHLDLLRLGFPHSYHTRGFYHRTAVLYHHCRGTAFRPLAWRSLPGGRWRIDWTRMRPNSPPGRS